mmetsp:Transcript_8680/g.9955  ORF Transcript_8680/g.9955 Transcript_8680/m.9955 type:complete len:184 (-) Transcript_8680:77-628(-)
MKIGYGTSSTSALEGDSSKTAVLASGTTTKRGGGGVLAVCATLLFVGGSLVAFQSTTDTHSTIRQGRSSASSLLRNSQRLTTHTVAPFPSEDCGTDFFLTAVYNAFGTEECDQVYFTSQEALDSVCEVENGICDKKFGFTETSTTQSCEDFGFVDVVQEGSGKDLNGPDSCYVKIYAKTIEKS